MAARHPTRTDLTAEFVRSILHYDPDTGVFRRKWRADVPDHINKRFAGKVAGSPKYDRQGNVVYWAISINGEKHHAHRLAWLHVHGEWPPEEIDHINGDGLDNRIANLRLASRRQNGANRRASRDSASRFKGVSWHKSKQCWIAQIQHAGKNHYLGRFDTAEEAHAAYVKAARELFGEFARAA